MKISVIIPTYNSEKYIEEAILSVVKSIPFENRDLIIIDGGSSDCTVEVLKKYEKEISFMISEKDKGIYDAMNKGISNSKGDYVIFLGSDDRLIFNYNELKKYLVDNNTSYYGNVKLKPTQKIYDGKFNLWKFINRNICHQSILYPKELLIEYKYEVKYRFLADYFMNIQIWKSKKYNFKYIPIIISEYNVLGLSSNNIDVEFNKDSIKIIYKHFGFLGLFFKSLNPIRKLFYNKYGN